MLFNKDGAINMSIQMYPANFDELPLVREPEEFTESNDYMVESGYLLDSDGWYRMVPSYPTNDFPRCLIQDWEEFFECKLHDSEMGGWSFDGTSLQLRQFLKYARHLHGDITLESVVHLSDYLHFERIENFIIRG
ncbi:hypothetical protein VP150E351_P0222 [Vibrio phage 150E35-1]|nr:hypothetical protein VP150E351_P0222 [Vibrio phage 150E35-1]